MKNARCFVCALLFLTVITKSSGQSSNIKIAPEKAWITTETFDKNAVPPAGQESSHYYLLIDEQENIPEQEYFMHYAYKILTSEGVQQMSDLSFGFDPAYEQLTLHALRIHRGGTVIDKRPNDIRTIQREQSMDRFLYDGSLTAVINLTDVRAGDIIEYSFTKKGYNPAYAGYVNRRIYFNYTVGFEKSIQRLIAPASLALSFKNVNTGIKPEVKKDGNLVEYTWRTGRVNGLVVDNNVPDWYNPYERVLISNYKDWKEVAAWATRLFLVSEKDKQRIKNEVLPAFDSDTPESFVLKVIRFVQDEVRYLGFETGLNSLKPHSPLKVYEQRFGDCKDKSLLLTTLLNAKGIEAYPVLVSTTATNKIADGLPSANAFNHCVVQVKLPDNTFYIDPTINNQGGKLHNYYFPAYGKGLVVSNATTDLVTFPDLVPSSITESQTFEMASIGGEGIFSVRTTYMGREADSQRSYFSNNTLESIQKGYLTFYGNLYPDIEKIDTIQVDDNREDNIFTVKEKYRIPSFWKPVENNAQTIYCEFYPQTLESYFNVAKSAQRTAPYILAHPVDYSHEIRINVPEEWTVTPDQWSVDNDYYQYDFSVRYADRTVSLSTHYKTKVSSIPMADFSTFVDDHEKMMSRLSYTLSYDKGLVKAASNKWPGIVVSMLVLGLSIGLILWLYHNYDPRPYYPAAWGIPIGGWLVLPVVGITISPAYLVFELLSSPELLTGEAWLTSLLIGRYDLFVFLLVAHVYNIAYLVFVVLVLVLLYQRRSSAPRMAIILYAVGCVFATLDAVLADQLMETREPGLYNGMWRAIIAAAIWIPYFYRSQRVKKTFVNVYRDNEEPGGLIPQPVATDQPL